ncbi:tRNA (adenosine(37)-N6)-threonylcarbamoyltransferase complex dimerization subunit type 1 TsaB [Candidatus Saccharibacteria bacterium]|nr:MAG: tRNA (adenosine(37)-N6)-threonylcarbamoyltransferase complex dimerization subunit type 1 TsaB [Candidatus Saccharibacteria bacterium]
MILAIKTAEPTAELAITDREGREIVRQEWLAERQLAKELLTRLESLLAQADTDWNHLSGLIVFKGPGSFTGLRIGITVMNTIAYAQEIPIVGQAGNAWLDDGIVRLKAGDNDQIVLPEYGAPARITQQRK